MDCSLGTWDFDIETGLLAIGPADGVIGNVRLPDTDAAPASLRRWLHPDDVAGLESAIRNWLACGCPAMRHAFRVVCHGGEWAWVEATGRKGADGLTLCGVWADVTAEKRAMAGKDEAVARVHQFAAAASHDLIGPLRHIAMYGDLLVSDFGTGATLEKREMLQAITDKARNLQMLTKRLIAFSTDTAAPEFVAVPIDRAIANVEKRLAVEIGQSGATVSGRSLPVVTGDPVLVEKVLENLLRNAIEWRGRRQPALSIEGRTAGRSAAITVADNGTGIDPRYTSRIFDAFWSLPRPGGEKGAGLGLAVCKNIIGALGGEITLASTSPEGSTFEIVLPLERAVAG